MTGKLVNKVAIITGASSGIGEATAIALSIEGAKVVITARRSDRLEAIAQKIREKGGQVLPIVADISDEAQVQRVIEQTQAKWETVDILINNAGVMLLGPIEGADTEDWRRMFNLNVLGLLYGIHRVLPIMKAQGSGHIINLSSVTGRWVKAGFAVYSATKWSINVISEALRQEVYKHNIRVTSIQPGLVETELINHITNPQAKQNAENYYQSMKNLSSEDIANAIVYALTQPPHVNINEILVRPTAQQD
ncbi:SDR family oxidoreductase [Nostoc sp. C117]|uniref:SDR family oxidoreductase n=1 Tax=Nostoc sp. C117 TaxID=3349875 RepID=UPI00370D6E7A